MDGWEMFSFTDMSSYRIPNEVLTGGADNIRPLETDFLRQEKIGEGPNSIVYKVKEVKTGKIFAVKHVKRSSSQPRLTRELFRELTILKSLNHEHVIKLHDIFSDIDPQHFLLVFELCKHDLDYFIAAHPYNLIKHDQIKCIALQLFRGLNYLHKSYIVHRDIKPKNLLITENGVLKIADFGLSRRFSSLEMPSTPGAMTLYYQAPEMLLMAPTYNEKVDIWSAGCVLIELLTKKPFFECRSELDLVKKMCEILGRPTSKNWPKVHECRNFDRVKWPAHPFNKLTDYLQQLNCSAAQPLLSDIIVYDPDSRLSAENCVKHEWFEQAPFPAKSIQIAKPDLIMSNMLQ